MTQPDNNVDQTKKLSEGLKELNPAAPIIIRTLGEFDPEDLFGTGMFDATSKKIDFEAKWLDNNGDRIDEVFGFNKNAELVNGRVAMVGFAMLLLTELVFSGAPVSHVIFGF